MAEPQRKSPRADPPEGFTTPTDTPSQPADDCAGDLSIAEAARFLEILGEGEDVWWFRAVDDDRKSGRRASNWSGVWERTAPLLDELSRDGFGVFVVVNAGGQNAEQIDRVRAVFVDLDGAPLEPVLACALEPQVVVNSSPGRWHAYWVTDGLELHQFETVQRAIAARFGGDPGVHDLPRIMRLPGSWHRKPHEETGSVTPHRVRIVHESGAQPYSAERVLAEFLGNGHAVASPERSAAPASLGSVPAGVSYMHDARRVELLDALRFLAERGSTWSPDDRSAWVRVGAALREFGPAGLEIWTEWSRQSSKFDEVDQRRTWATLKPATGSDHLRVDTIFRAALDLGWVAPATEAAQAEPEPPPPAFVDFDPHAEYEPIRYAVEHIIPREMTTLLSGHGGAGKSQLGLILAAHVACGKPWAGLSVEQGPALFLSLEDGPRVIAARIGRIVEAYGLDAARMWAQLRIANVRSGSESALAVEGVTDTYARTLVRAPAFFDALERMKGCALVVIDNASDAYDATENERRYVRKFMRWLGAAAEATGAAVVLLTHVDKAGAKFGTNGNSYSGSSAWHNSARSRLALIRDAGRGANAPLSLVHEKANHGRALDPVALTFSPAGVLVPVAHESAAAGVTQESRAAAAAIVAKSDAEHILSAMRAAIAQGERVSAARTGPKTAQHVLATFDELPTDLRGRSGRERFWRGWDRLVKDGRVAVMEERDRYRNLVRIATPTTTPEAYANAKDGGGA